MRSVVWPCYNVNCDPLEVSLGSGRYVGLEDPDVRAVELNRGEGMPASTSVGRVARSVADCDRALVRLRVLARSGSVEERELARLSIDHVLDRRLVLSKIEMEGGR